MLAVDRDDLRSRLVDSLSAALPSMRDQLSDLVDILDADVKPRVKAEPDEDVKPDVERDEQPKKKRKKDVKCASAAYVLAEAL